MYNRFLDIRGLLRFVNRISVLLIILNSFTEAHSNDVNQFGNSIAQESSIKPAGVFQSNMVIQQEMPIRIWGQATKGTTIRVSLGNKSKIAKSNADDEWMVVFSPIISSDKPLTITINDGFRFENILVGEVWLCTGQSNMAFTLKKSEGASGINTDSFSRDIRLLNYRGLRLVAKDGYTDEELKKCNVHDFFQGNWVENSQSTAETFSAVGWYFGNYIRKSINVPVGLISLSVGGAAINNFIPTAVLRNSTLTRDLFLKDWLTNTDVKIDHRERAKQAFQNVLKPNEPYLVGKTPYRWMCEPGFIFDAGLMPLKNLSFRGVIWYQGESDTDNRAYCDRYKKLFPMMIHSWRNYFSNGNFPFLFVQLPGFGNELWPYFREIQSACKTTVSNVRMAVTIDLGLEDNIHPPGKEPIGYRLSALALKYVYGKKLLADAPEVRNIVSERNKIILNFKNTGDGFQKTEEDIIGFEILGQNGEFHPVNAKRIGASKVELIHNISAPSKIRYAWMPFPKPSVRLFNSNGIPLAPFLISMK